MTCIGFDHHKKWTQAAAIDDQGKIIREMRVLNDRNSLKGFLKGLPKPLKGVVEAGPRWGWIYDTLSELGVKMMVAKVAVKVCWRWSAAVFDQFDEVGKFQFGK